MEWPRTKPPKGDVTLFSTQRGTGVCVWAGGGGRIGKDQDGCAYTHTHTHTHRTTQLTTPLELLTPFILIFVTNLTKGGASGYLGPHSILRLYIRFS
jgi:hypothetical protein